MGVEKMRRIGTRNTTAILGAFGAALLLAGAATADKEQIHLTAAGQKAARAAVMQRADLGDATGWTGGAKKPDLSPGTGCANFDPKQSDLVLIGAAETVFKHTGVEFDSEAQVLQTPAMVRLDWQRTVLSPQVLPCVRTNIQKHLAASERLVSVGRLAFPAVAPYTRAYRVDRGGHVRLDDRANLRRPRPARTGQHRDHADDDRAAPRRARSPRRRGASRTHPRRSRDVTS